MLKSFKRFVSFPNQLTSNQAKRNHFDFGLNQLTAAPLILCAYIERVKTATVMMYGVQMFST